MIIGIDFDNTIVNYDTVFSKRAYQRKFIKHKKNINKEKLKKLISKQQNSLKKWQILQGEVYGKYIHHAKIYNGFKKFIYLSRS